MIKGIEDALSSIRGWSQFKQQQPLSVELVEKLAVDMEKLGSEVCHLPSSGLRRLHRNG